MFDFGKKNFDIGIDISDHSIEMLQFKKIRNDGVFEIAAYSRGLIPAGVLSFGEILQPDVLVKLLMSLYKNPTWGTYLGNNAILAMPAQQVYSHVFRQDVGVLGTSLQEKVYTEASALFPIDFARSTVKWSIRQRKENSALYVVAVENRILKSYQDVIRQAGFLLTVIEPQSLSIRRGIYRDYLTSDQMRIYLHIGAKSTIMALSSSDGVYVNYTLPFGGFHITHSIADKLQISLKEAEQLKRKYGFSPEAKDGRVFLVIQSSLRILMEEITRLTAYVKEHYGVTIERIDILGGSSLMPGITDYIESNSGIATNLVTLVPHTYPVLDKSLRAIVPCVVGLAIRAAQRARGVMTAEINLMK